MPFDPVEWGEFEAGTLASLGDGELGKQGKAAVGDGKAGSHDGSGQSSSSLSRRKPDAGCVLQDDAGCVLRLHAGCNSG